MAAPDSAWDCFDASSGDDDSELDTPDEQEFCEPPARDAANGILAFHKGVEEQMLRAVACSDSAGDPAATLAAVDRFCYERHWMMHVGDVKGKFLREAVRSAPRPLRAVELGAYCGYSAVLIGSELGADGSLLSLDVEPQCVAWTERLVGHAGLTDGRITVRRVTGADGPDVAAAVAASRAEAGPAPRAEARSGRPEPWISLLFLDHDKSRYLEDLRAIEPWLVPGAVVVADNVESFDGGASLRAYCDHVRDPQGPFASSRARRAPVEYSLPDDGPAEMDSVEVSVFRGGPRRAEAP
jgi:catechol O-methyltransferase